MDEDDFDSMSETASISTESSSYQQLDGDCDWYGYDHYDSDPYAYDGSNDGDNDITSDNETEDEKQDTVSPLVFRYSLHTSLITTAHNSHSHNCIQQQHASNCRSGNKSD